MTVADQDHQIAADIALRAPGTFIVKATPQGLSGLEPGSGAALSVLLKLTPLGGVTAERLAESALALLQKKHPGLQRVGGSEAAQGRGWRGRLQVLRADSTPTAPVAVVVTTLIHADPSDPGQQRNVIVVLEVPQQLYEQRTRDYRGFAEQRLQIGAPAAAAPSALPLSLELVPLEVPEPAAAEVPPAPEPLAARQPAPRATSVPAARAPAAATPAAASRSTAAPRSSARQAAAAAPAEMDEDELLMSAAHGQKVLAYSILLNILARGINNVPDIPVFMLNAVAMAILFYAISGVLKIATGFGYSLNQKLALMFCSSVPLLGIGCWIYLSVKTSGRLRAAGYQVGLFGVKS